MTEKHFQRSKTQTAIYKFNIYFNIFYQRGILHGLNFLGNTLLHIFEKYVFNEIIFFVIVFIQRYII